jgi:hypothetical protein
MADYWPLTEPDDIVTFGSQREYADDGALTYALGPRLTSRIALGSSPIRIILGAIARRLRARVRQL